ncbi:exodeoxyribonuclease VII small subunit [Roseicyclus sp.]|jgi:exodeoxyribonuclease VII small subunit|uniref:exodeoxyribonuclease VII small subunit n=1 Tax=Roseicyclus sp. TaxID=1914329 RepID=UPI003FA03979
MTGKPIGEMTFEEAIREFESVVQKLDRGDVPLEESIDLYKRGAALKARCEAKLKEAEEQVEQITMDANGQATGTTPAEGL